MPIPLDEYPLHQAPLSLEHPVSSDRNFYDRCYFNAHDRSGDVFLITGVGYYPNLGVMDAYATVGRGGRNVNLHASDAISNDRMNQQIGPYRIEVIDPLQKIRLVCDGDEWGVGFDLTWTGSFPAVQEQPHVMRAAGRVILDACRFAQVGTWSGELRVEGTTYDVTDDRWLGTRDRSWGIRPVGEPEPGGRAAAESDPNYGFWWTYVPLRFDDFALVVIVQEDANGNRILNDAVRVWPESTGKAPEMLGWPQIDIHYRSGTREATGATITMVDPQRRPVVVEVTSHGSVALHCGAGYGGDPDWSHGQWRGRNWVEGTVVDQNDPAIAGRVPFGVIDHVATATCDGQVGSGLFEHASIGAHAPSGFADFGSVAPDATLLPMTFPTDIGVIDTMVGTRAGGSQQYAFLKGALRDSGSAKMQFPAEYMFKDVPYKGKDDGEAPQGADLLLPHMDAHGVDIAMIGVSDTNEPGRLALERHPNRFVGCFSIDPNQGMAGVRALVDAHDRWGIVAAACFPAGFQPQVAINHARMYPFYAKCIELDIPIFVNAGVPGPRVPMACQSVEHFDEICYEFPELRIVMRHGAEPDTALAVKLMLKWPNLYYSTSAFAPKHYPSDIVAYANTRGSEKVLYAGYFPMGLSLDRIFAELPDVPFHDDVWPKFLRTNAQKVLKLS